MEHLYGKHGRFWLVAASAAAIFSTLYMFGIMPFVGISRDYSTQEYDRPLGRGSEAPAPRLQLSNLWTPAPAAPSRGGDVVARFHAALRVLNATHSVTVSAGQPPATAAAGDSSSSGGGSSSPNLAGEWDSFPEAACPAELQLGVRPVLHTPALFGNGCEPWAARGAVLLLGQLLGPGMAGLEWGAGASTAWYLGRLGRLVSVEHNASWAEQVTAQLRRGFSGADLAERWQLHVAPPSRPVLTFSDAEAYEPFKAYVDVQLGDDDAQPKFDFIAIDGQARVACLQRALWLLRPHGGVLLLNGAQRRSYAGEVEPLIPRHWLRYRGSSGPFGETAVWVSCEEGQCGA